MTMVSYSIQQVMLHSREVLGEELRALAGVDEDLPIDPRRFAQEALGYVIVTPEDIPTLDARYRNQLLGPGSDHWSGGACVDLPVILINPTHSQGRISATMMEEIVHKYRHHSPTKLVTQYGYTWHGGYNREQEEEARKSGAAALVPPRPL